MNMNMIETRIPQSEARPGAALSAGHSVRSSSCSRRAPAAYGSCHVTAPVDNQVFCYVDALTLDCDRVSEAIVCYDQFSYTN